MANDESTATEDLAPEEEGLDEVAKPTLRQMKKRSWVFAFKRAIKEFSADGCTDLAAALTYFAVLSIFPGLVAVFSLLGVVGQGDAAALADRAGIGQGRRIRHGGAGGDHRRVVVGHVGDRQRQDRAGVARHHGEAAALDP